MYFSKYARAQTRTFAEWKALDWRALYTGRTSTSMSSEPKKVLYARGSAVLQWGRKWSACAPGKEALG